MRVVSAPAALIATLVATALLLAPTLVPVAHADTGRIEDGTNEPYTLPDRMNIVRVTIANGPRRIVLTTRFVEVRDGARSNVKVAIIPGGDEDRTYIATSSRSRSGRTTGTLQRATDQEFGGVPVRCDGYRARWNERRNTARIVVPHRCMGPSAGAHRFKAVSGFFNDMNGDYTRFKRVARG